MCGICGEIGLGRPPGQSEALVTAMARTMSHRGPDEGGTFTRATSGPAGEVVVALGHCRLSIVDLTGGRQPLFNENGHVAVIANAEIYNYPQLRGLLLERGHSLATNSDCEAIVHLYEDVGLDFVRHLAGMFALALWDQDKQRLILARDRMGVKPLHYFQQGDLLVFASEIKALLAHPVLERRVNLKSLYKYLSYEYIPAPDSIFEGVRKVEPGQLVIWEKGRVRTETYWDLRISEEDARGFKEEECLERLEQLFDQAVKRRLMADVEVGAFLSGGVDSGLVVTRARKFYNQPMKVFTFGFEDKTFDETPYAQQVAKLAGADFHCEILTEQKLLDVIPRLNTILDEPMADPSVVPTYLLSQLAAQHVKVALSGDGSDDILAGYVTYPALKLINYYKALPSEIRTWINRGIVNLPVKHSYVSLDFKLKQFMRGAGYSSEIMFFLWMGSFNNQEKLALMHPQHLAALEHFNTYEDLFRYMGTSRLSRDMERILYMMIKLYLQDDILVKVDRASMACSLEVRSPFMDHDLVEYINSLPSSYKLRRLTTKHILKKLALRHLPKEIVLRKKKGFGIPIGAWFRGQLKDLLCDYLAPARIEREGFFNPRVVQGLVDAHLSGAQDNRKPLWTLLMFEMWMDQWMKS